MEKGCVYCTEMHLNRCADAFTETSKYCKNYNHKEAMRLEERDEIEALKKQLNPDLVEVVRCKDCKNFRKENNGEKWCGCFDGGIGSNENDYCSHGERR